MFYNYCTDGCGLHPNAPNSTKRRGMINAEKVLKEDTHEKIIIIIGDPPLITSTSINKSLVF